MKLTLIRHGSSELNLRNRGERRVHVGRLDSALSPVGREQAEALRVRQAAIFREVSEVYVSSAGRALATAECLFPGRPLRVDERLQERSLGELEGKPLEHKVVCTAQPWQARPPGGESWEDVVERVGAFLRALPWEGDDHRVVVSHKGAIRCMLSVLLSLDRVATLSLAIPHCEPFAVVGHQPTACRPASGDLGDAR